MRFMIYRQLWGMDGPLELFLARIKQEGYDGVEADLPPPETQREFRRLVESCGLEYIPIKYFNISVMLRTGSWFC